MDPLTKNTGALIQANTAEVAVSPVSVRDCGHDRSRRRVLRPLDQLKAAATGLGIAADCEPTLSPPTEENPSTSQQSKDNYGLGRLGDVIRLGMKDEVYRAWFGKVSIVEETSSVLILAAPTRFVCNRIKQDYEHKFASWCQAIGKEKLEIIVASSAAYMDRIARQSKDSP